MTGGAAGRGRMRASHADREHVIEVLKDAFAQGRLTREELDTRAGQAFASRTYAELAALTADIPTRLTSARPPEPARQTVNKPARQTVNKPARQTVNKKAVAALTGATLTLVGTQAAVRAMPDATPWPVALPVIVVALVLYVAVPTGWLWLFHEWLDKRAGRQSAQGLPPGAGGDTPQHMAPADPGRHLPPGNDRHWHTADAAPIVRPRLQPS